MSNNLTIYHLQSQHEQKEDGNYINLLRKSKKHTSKQIDKYYDIEKYWGSIIVFSANERSDHKYAHLISPDGCKCNSITKATFRMFSDLPGTKHVYVNRIQQYEFDNIKAKIKLMSKEQLIETVQIAEGHINKINGTEFKEGIKSSHHISGEDHSIITDLKHIYIKQYGVVLYTIDTAKLLHVGYILDTLIQIYNHHWCSPQLFYNVVAMLQYICVKVFDEPIQVKFCPSGQIQNVNWPQVPSGDHHGVGNSDF